MRQAYIFFLSIFFPFFSFKTYGSSYEAKPLASEIQIQNGTWVIPGKSRMEEVERKLLVSIKHSVQSGGHREKIELNFSGKSIPVLQALKEGKKISVDIFKAGISPNIKSIGKGLIVKEVDVYDIDEDILTLEISLEKDGMVGVFYEQTPHTKVVIEINV